MSEDRPSYRPHAQSLAGEESQSDNYNRPAAAGTDEVERIYSRPRIPTDAGTEFQLLPRTHMLKSWPVNFEELVTGRKRFDVRYALDRNFQAGDRLMFREFEPRSGRYTGNVCSSIIVAVYHHGPGLQAGDCALSLGDVKLHQPNDINTG